MKKSNFVKAFIAVVFCFSVLSVSAFNLLDNDKPIEVSQLPKAAQAFINTHFTKSQVTMATMETGIDRDYTVLFSNGDKVEFDRKGNWTDVSSRQSSVPAALVPAQISKYVKNKFKDATIKEIERDGRGYEVKLSNGLDVKFNKKFKVIEIDD